MCGGFSKLPSRSRRRTCSVFKTSARSLRHNRRPALNPACFLMRVLWEARGIVLLLLLNASSCARGPSGLRGFCTLRPNVF